MKLGGGLRRLLGLLALSPLFVEGAARLAALVDPEPLYAYAADQPLPGVEWDPEVGARLPPGYAWRVRSPGLDVQLRTDPVHGLRGPEPGPAPRWLLLGDSFVFARIVPEEATMAARLAEAAGVRVLNAGMDAWSTRQSVARYRQLAGGVDPDRVLLVFFEGNDFADNSGPHPPRAMPGPAPPRPWLRRHSYALAYAEVLRRGAQLARADHLPRELEMYRRGAQPPGQAETRAALAELRQLAAARGDAVLVAAAPPGFALDPAVAARLFGAYGIGPEALDLAAPHALTLRLLRELGLPACDLAPTLASPGAFNRLEGHWSLEGQQRVADALLTCIEQG